MRLRTRLALGFAAVAAVPVLALSIPARNALSHGIEDALAARLDGATRAAQLAVDDARRESERAAAELATSEPLETLAQAERDGDADPAQAALLAQTLMSARGIDVLEILDGKGTVISSGHLPGRVGDRDLQGLALAREGGARLARVDVASGEGIASVLAIVAGQPVEGGGAELFVLAGKRLDATFAQKLAELTGAQVTLVGAEVPEASSRPPLAGTRVRERALPLSTDFANGPRATIRLRLSAEGLYAAEAKLSDSVLGLALLALAAALLLGLAFARRITRPVDALAEGARALARGERDHRVQARASGEIAELVAAFNGMAAELESATSRAVLAERIAAWQEVARRLAHEVKNPLTPIRTSIETLQLAFQKKRADFGEIFDESAKAILEEVERLKRIVDEFSRFARLPRPNLEPLDLRELVTSTLALYAGSPLRLRSELAELPPVRADRDQLTQVLVNLLQNAEQAMPSGGECLVRVFALPSGEVALEVADAGPGIPEPERAHIFDPYFTTKPGGSGLGLAIAARIAGEHGGRIELHPSPLGGAAIRVVLPASRAERSAG